MDAPNDSNSQLLITSTSGHLTLSPMDAQVLFGINATTAADPSPTFKFLENPPSYVCESLHPAVLRARQLAVTASSLEFLGLQSILLSQSFLHAVLTLARSLPSEGEIITRQNVLDCLRLRQLGNKLQELFNAIASHPTTNGLRPGTWGTWQDGLDNVFQKLCAEQYGGEEIAKAEPVLKNLRECDEKMFPTFWVDTTERLRSGGEIENVENNFKSHIPDLTDKVILVDRHAVFPGVYSCVCRGEWDGKPVAVKIIRSISQDQQAIKRKLKRERETWSRLRHVNVLDLLGYTQANDRFGDLGALISPWCKNGDAETWLEKHRLSLTFINRRDLWHGIVAGVGYLHTNDPMIVHGDLKPTNILISDDGTPKICDFGLVQVMLEEGGGGFTTSSGHAGTNRYLAPELLKPDARPTTAGDIYALGCVGLTFLFDRIPYGQHLNVDREVIAAQIKSGMPPASCPASLDAEAKWYWDLLVICWPPNPDERVGAQWICANIPEPSNEPQIPEYNGIACDNDRIVERQDNYIDRSGLAPRATPNQGFELPSEIEIHPHPGQMSDSQQYEHSYHTGISPSSATPTNNIHVNPSESTSVRRNGALDYWKDDDFNSIVHSLACNIEQAMTTLYTLETATIKNDKRNIWRNYRWYTEVRLKLKSQWEAVIDIMIRCRANGGHVRSLQEHIKIVKKEDGIKLLEDVVSKVAAVARSAVELEKGHDGVLSPYYQYRREFTHSLAQPPQRRALEAVVVALRQLFNDRPRFLWDVHILRATHYDSVPPSPISREADLINPDGEKAMRRFETSTKNIRQLFDSLATYLAAQSIICEGYLNALRSSSFSSMLLAEIDKFATSWESCRETCSRIIQRVDKVCDVIMVHPVTMIRN